MKDIEKALEKAKADQTTTPTSPTPPQEDVQALSEEAYTPETVAADPSAPSTNSPHGLAGLSSTAIPADSSAKGNTILNADFDYFREFTGGTGKKASSVDGAFRVLRTQVLDAMREKNMRVVGITSPAENAGKTVTAIQLALACARRENQNVVLADFDYRRPSVAPYLKATEFRSSTELFRNKGRVEDYLYRTEQGNLKFLLASEHTDMSAEYLASPQMDDVLKTLTKERDTIVIADLPPMIGCDDTMAIMPKLDGVLMVVAAGEQGYSSVENVLGQIPEQKLVAAVLNKVPRLGSQYQYSYGTSRRG